MYPPYIHTHILTYTYVHTYILSKTESTAGESIGKLLRDPKCFLTKLCLTWNMIRFASGVALTRALTVNTSLTFLDVRYACMYVLYVCTMYMIVCILYMYVLRISVRGCLVTSMNERFLYYMYAYMYAYMPAYVSPHITNIRRSIPQSNPFFVIIDLQSNITIHTYPHIHTYIHTYMQQLQRPGPCGRRSAGRGALVQQDLNHAKHRPQ